MADPQLVLVEAEPTISVVEVADPETLTVSEKVIELVDVGIQGPPGPPGVANEMISDPLAYYILAKN